jgi:hypothetical protein
MDGWVGGFGFGFGKVDTKTGRWSSSVSGFWHSEMPLSSLISSIKLAEIRFGIERHITVSSID